MIFFRNLLVVALIALVIMTLSVEGNEKNRQRRLRKLEERKKSRASDEGASTSGRPEATDHSGDYEIANAIGRSMYSATNNEEMAAAIRAMAHMLSGMQVGPPGIVTNETEKKEKK
ncbi:uncharacterized protein LOC116344383 [Contarinia nasturtii]|uniref:uncharacterized protein LOC116344383 n=1 Tax=Contarinia nasturtii TaxID=265458 RepID=UPI0012D3EA67|nr:uncharacterized protein LOC116344383 [Contarinia nasturtii]